MEHFHFKLGALDFSRIGQRSSIGSQIAGILFPVGEPDPSSLRIFARGKGLNGRGCMDFSSFGRI